MNKTTTKKMMTEPLKLNEDSEMQNEFFAQPGNHVINNILNFSKALSIKKLKNERLIELVLN
jgi:hypothetical protein